MTIKFTFREYALLISDLARTIAEAAEADVPSENLRPYVLRLLELVDAQDGAEEFGLVFPAEEDDQTERERQHALIEHFEALQQQRSSKN